MMINMALSVRLRWIKMAIWRLQHLQAELCIKCRAEWVTHRSLVGHLCDTTCAVSATGQGEYFMRLLIAYDISAQMRYKKIDLTQASEAAIQRLTELGGHGGVIALDRQGNACMPFNTAGMYRGYIDGVNIKTDIF